MSRLAKPEWLRPTPPKNLRYPQYGEGRYVVTGIGGRVAHSFEGHPIVALDWRIEWPVDAHGVREERPGASPPGMTMLRDYCDNPTFPHGFANGIAGLIAASGVTWAAGDDYANLVRDHYGKVLIASVKRGVPYKAPYWNHYIDWAPSGAASGAAT